MKKIIVAAFASVALFALAPAAMAETLVSGAGHFGSLNGTLLSKSLKQDGGKDNTHTLGVIGANASASEDVTNYGLKQNTVPPVGSLTDSSILIAIAFTDEDSKVVGDVTFKDMKQLGGIGNSASGIIAGAVSSAGVSSTNYFK